MKEALRRWILPILGDPGAVSLFKGQKCPWELPLTEPVPEIFEFVPLISQKNDFSGQSAKRSSRGTVAFLHDVVFFLCPSNKLTAPGSPRMGFYHEFSSNSNAGNNYQAFAPLPPIVLFHDMWKQRSTLLYSLATFSHSFSALHWFSL